MRLLNRYLNRGTLPVSSPGCRYTIIAPSMTLCWTALQQRSSGGISILCDQKIWLRVRTIVRQIFFEWVRATTSCAFVLISCAQSFHTHTHNKPPNVSGKPTLNTGLLRVPSVHAFIEHSH